MSELFIICGNENLEEEVFYECDENDLNIYIEEDYNIEEYIDNKLLYFMIIFQYVRCTLEYI